MRLRAGLEARLRRVRDAVVGRPRPRVAALEWLDPPYIGGHWVPEMIEAAGGTDPLGEPGAQVARRGLGGDPGRGPDVVVVMPCGLYADEALEQALDRRAEIESLGADRVLAVDAAASFSRPGPRLVDGAELLAHLLHPGAAPAPRGWAGVRLLEGTRLV